MKKSPFYKKGLGYPLQQTADNNIEYSDQPLLQNGKVSKDPHAKFDKGTGTYTHFTDPVTGDQTMGGERTSKEAFDVRNMDEFKDLTEKQYTDFSKIQLANYRDTGNWISYKDYNARQQDDITARNTSVGTGDSIVSSGGGSIESIGFTPSYTPSSTSGEFTPIDINLSGGKKPGLVRQAKDGKWSDTVVDTKVGEQGKAGRGWRKAQKEISKAEGMTRRETRLQKTLGKAVVGAAAAGAKVDQKNKAGDIIRSSHTPGMKNKNAAYGGRARKKAARMIRRANRIASRMKSYEGGNYSKNF